MRPVALRPALLVVLLALPVLGGCFQLRTLLRLNADGSGTIEETVALVNEARGYLTLGDSTGGPLGMYDVDSLRARAADLGPGVTFVRVDTLDEQGYFGYRAVYHFDDVRRVSYYYNERPIMAPGSEGASGRASSNSFFAGTNENLPVTFDFAPGRLTVRMPDPPQSGARAAELDPAAVAAAANALRQQFTTSEGAMMRQTMGSVRLAIAVELPGTVTRTTAAHAEGTTLTLTDLTFGALFDVIAEKPELFARASMLEAQGTPDARPVLRAIAARPGIRYELRPEVTAEW